mmetsp:Transcript_17089/g.54910  ORF Transcript_17089/g.54910 Transcript_17089/m.54910 type:complete len:398 (-) Transcript_17089:20-1213(-)
MSVPGGGGVESSSHLRSSARLVSRKRASSPTRMPSRAMQSCVHRSLQRARCSAAAAPPPAAASPASIRASSSPTRSIASIRESSSPTNPDLGAVYQTSTEFGSVGGCGAEAPPSPAAPPPRPGKLQPAVAIALDTRCHPVACAEAAAGGRSRASSRAESALFVASSDLMVAVYARVRHSSISARSCRSARSLRRNDSTIATSSFWDSWPPAAAAASSSSSSCSASSSCAAAAALSRTSGSPGARAAARRSYGKNDFGSISSSSSARERLGAGVQRGGLGPRDGRSSKSPPSPASGAVPLNHPSRLARASVRCLSISSAWPHAAAGSPRCACRSGCRCSVACRYARCTALSAREVGSQVRAPVGGRSAGKASATVSSIATRPLPAAQRDTSLDDIGLF